MGRILRVIAVGWTFALGLAACSGTESIRFDAGHRYFCERRFSASQTESEKQRLLGNLMRACLLRVRQDGYDLAKSEVWQGDVIVQRSWASATWSLGKAGEFIQIQMWGFKSGEPASEEQLQGTRPISQLLEALADTPAK